MGVDAAGCGELMVVRVGGGWEMLVGIGSG